MAKTKFTFTTAEGKVETRTSERTYTHVVVRRTNVAYLRKCALDPAWSKEDANAFRYYSKMAACEVGEIPQGRRYPMEAAEKRASEAAVAGCSDEADYIAKKQQARLDAITKEYGDADVGPEYVAQWSMSEVNARKGAQPGVFYASVRVAPVDQK